MKRKKALLASIKKGLWEWQLLIRHRAFVSPKTQRDIVDNFHRFYYDSHLLGNSWEKISWLGTRTHKCPFDFWIYQEIINKVRPAMIIECGTKFGGGALFLASMCDLVNNGEIVTIDIKEQKGRPDHERITYLTGSSTSDEIVGKVCQLAKGKEPVLVILDSDHRKGHVLREMEIYGDLVTPGSYMIVEDTNMNGHPVYPEFGPGPMEAVQDFLRTHRQFVVDKSQEKLYLTFNPSGYLRKVYSNGATYHDGIREIVKIT